MKLLITLLSLLPLTLFAQEMSDGTNAPQTEKTISIWQALIPIAVPLIIMGIKNLIPRLPKKVTPWLAPLLGALIDVLLNLADLGDGKGLVGGVLGLGGIGVRELLHNSLKGDSEPKYKIPAAILILIPFLTFGCSTIDKNADPVVVQTERTLNIALETFDVFLKIEKENRVVLEKISPEIKQTADLIRKHGKNWISTANALKLAYKQNRTLENKANLITALAVVQSAMTESQKYIAIHSTQ